MTPGLDGVWSGGTEDGVENVEVFQWGVSEPPTMEDLASYHGNDVTWRGPVHKTGPARHQGTIAHECYSSTKSSLGDFTAQ